MLVRISWAVISKNNCTTGKQKNKLYNCGFSTKYMLWQTNYKQQKISQIWRKNWWYSKIYIRMVEKYMQIGHSWIGSLRVVSMRTQAMLILVQALWMRTTAWLMRIVTMKCSIQMATRTTMALRCAP